MLWESCVADAVEHGALKILCGTWNVNSGRPPQESLHIWLGGPERAEDADLAVIGLQEIEAGPWSMARAAAMDLVSKSELQVLAGSEDRQGGCVSHNVCCSGDCVFARAAGEIGQSTLEDRLACLQL